MLWLTHVPKERRAGLQLATIATIQRSHATAEAVLHPYLSQMDPLVFGQYADECLYLTKLVMIFGPLEMLSKLQLHLWSAREGGCALHLRKARGTIMVHSLDALRGESK
jgi:hypothetical protein